MTTEEKKRILTWKRESGRPGASQRQRNPNQRAWGLDWVRLAALGCAQGPSH